MQSRHTGDYCTVNASPSPCLLSDCHRTATVNMLQKNCVTPQNEDAEMWNSDVKNTKDRQGAGLGRVYCGMT